jgi:hypothetical protein
VAAMSLIALTEPMMAFALSPHRHTRCVGTGRVLVPVFANQNQESGRGQDRWPYQRRPDSPVSPLEFFRSSNSVLPERWLDLFELRRNASRAGKRLSGQVEWTILRPSNLAVKLTRRSPFLSRTGSQEIGSTLQPAS